MANDRRWLGAAEAAGPMPIEFRGEVSYKSRP